MLSYGSLKFEVFSSGLIDFVSLIFYSLITQDTHLLLTGGFEKVLRIYDLNRSDAPPREVDKSPGSIRNVAWLHSDQTILSSCTDMGGVRYAYLVNILEAKSYTS